MHSSASSSPEVQEQRKPLVLITDDDRSLQMLLKVAMEQQGFVVAQASSGEQCLRDYQRLQPDMVLLDAVMPGVDGFECCRQLRQLPGAAQVPVLMITVLDDQDSVSQAFEAGATDYITKPIYWAVLSHRVQRLLASYKTFQQAEQVLHDLERYRDWGAVQQQYWHNFQTLAPEAFIRFSLQTLKTFTHSDRCSLCGDFEQIGGLVQAMDYPEGLLPWSTLPEVSQGWLSTALETGDVLHGEAPTDLEPLQALCDHWQATMLRIYPVPLKTGSTNCFLLCCGDRVPKSSVVDQDSMVFVAQLVAIVLQLN